jgi:hypothetical protein
VEKATRAGNAAPMNANQPVDVDQAYRRAAIQGLRDSDEFWASMRADGMWWWRIGQILMDSAPPEKVVGNRWNWARNVVRQALTDLLGKQDTAWRTDTRQWRGKDSAWVSALIPVRPPARPEPDEPPF